MLKAASLLALALTTLSGCAAPTAPALDDAQADDVGSDEAEIAAGSRRYPVCANAGTRSEAWTWSDTGARIKYASCAGKAVTCGAFGTRSEGWYAGGERVAWASCGTAETTRLRSLSAGLQYPSESDYAFDVVLAPGAGSGLGATKLKTLLGIPASEPVETTTVDEVLSARRFEEHPDAAKFEALRKALKGYKAYRVGTIQVQIYLVKVTGGNLVGLHTVSIET